MNWKLIGGSGLFFGFLYLFGGIIQAALLIPSIADWLAPLGIGKHFAFVLAIPIFFWFNFALGKIFSLRKMNRIIGLVMILGFFGILSLFQGVKSYGNLFDQETGAPLRVYARDPITGKINIYSPEIQFDPANGQKTSPLTQEILNEMEIKKRDAWKNGGLLEMREFYQSISE